MGGVEKSGAQGKMHMQRLGWLIWLGVAAFLCVPPSFAAGDADEAGDGPGEAVVLGEEDFAERLEILRNQFRRMTPGDGELVQDAGAWPAAWEEFSPRWDTAPATRDLATWVVPVSSEREGGATVLRDGNGAELWRGTTDFAKETSTNVTLTGALVDESDWPLYTAVQEELAWRRAAEAGRQESGELRGYTNGPCTTGLHFVSAEGNFTTTPPELHVGLAWTNNGTVDVFAYGPLHVAVTNEVTWTNDENVVETTNVMSWHAAEPTLTGFGNTWKWVGSLAVSNTGTNVFIDSSFPTNRGIVRYYAAAEAVDSDGDGLNDGFETFVFHSDPELGDSDGDGIGDGLEVALGADPADAENRPRVLLNAVFYNTGDSSATREWVELYSAEAQTVDLSEFRLEVARTNDWYSAAVFGPGTAIAPGQCLLAGGSLVTNADVEAVLEIPDNGPTGVRLVWNGATNGAVLDAVMIGGNTNFVFDASGWLSSTSIWAYAGKAVERRYPGWDTDRIEDWRWVTNRTGQASGLDIDSDGDGLSDAVERAGTTNVNGPWSGEPTDPWNADSDGDGLGDYDECMVHGTNPNAWASDGDIWPWMPEGTLAEDWPGSDAYELASNTWNPLLADQNENGFPDSWEMVLDLSALLNGADSDGDGVDDVAEIYQNSNPLDIEDFCPRPFVIRYESLCEEWANNGMSDIGWGGCVKVHFEGVTRKIRVNVWVKDHSDAEPFSMFWTGATQSGVFWLSDGLDGIAHAELTPMSHSCLTIQDARQFPNYINTLGGEYTVEEFEVDLDGDNESDGDVDDEDDEEEERLPVVVASREDNQVLTVRKTTVIPGATLKIQKTGEGGVSLEDLSGNVLLGPEDSESDDLLEMAATGDVSFLLKGSMPGEVYLSLLFQVCEFTCVDLCNAKVVLSDVVQRRGSSTLATLIGEQQTHSGIDDGTHVTDIADMGVETISLAEFEAEGTGLYPKRYRLAASNCMARRIWAKVHDNMLAGIHSMPTDSHPWNLFTTASNYETSNCNEFVLEQFKLAIAQTRSELSKPEQLAEYDAYWYPQSVLTSLVNPTHLVMFSGSSPSALPFVTVMENALEYRSKCMGQPSLFVNNYEGAVLFFFVNSFTMAQYSAGFNCPICGKGANLPEAPWYFIPFLQLWDEAHHSTITPDCFGAGSKFEKVTY